MERLAEGRLAQGKRKQAGRVPEGGMLWLARDCIRTSRLEEAEDLLKRYERKNPTDYKALCGLAFIKIEKKKLSHGGRFPTEALNQPTTALQKTYLHFMLSRALRVRPRSKQVGRAAERCAGDRAVLPRGNIRTGNPEFPRKAGG